ncbi:MAG: recombinase family protein [Deltaproteobacteria bacterium]|nr:recombinase family protein [Deltaproteobacteria bacterium]
MAEYIYTRVSTDGQSTEPQIRKLAELHPDARVISEVASGAKKRPMLQALVEQLTSGDILIVAALDRLGRRTSEILRLIEDLEQRGVVLKSLREGVDYSTLTGRLVTQILVSIAEMERNLISERTKAGLEAVRKKGRRLGRPSYIPEEVKKAAVDLVAAGLSKTEAARRTGVSRQYVSSLVRMNRQGVERMVHNFPLDLNALV